MPSEPIVRGPRDRRSASPDAGPDACTSCAGSTSMCAAGEILAILGASGVGKSTLLHILGTLDRPTRGSVGFRGGNVFDLSDRDRAGSGTGTSGSCSSSTTSCPSSPPQENVMMPGLIARHAWRTARRRAAELLEAVGLADRVRHKPHELSGRRAAAGGRGPLAFSRTRAWFWPTSRPGTSTRRRPSASTT